MAYKHILLIDDDVEDQEIFKAALTIVSADIQCTSFTNAQDALDKLHRINPDVIFLDLNMPIMSGQEFLTAMKNREHIQHIPVIIFSTSSNTGTIQQTKQLGATDFITKPDRFDKLIDLLKPIIN